MSIKIGIKDLVNEATLNISTISAKDAIARYGSASTVFVDVRDVRELYREGMIPNAFHSPRGMLEFWVDPSSPYHKDIFSDMEKVFVLYCQSSWRSALATFTLKKMGMTNVKHLSGGLNAWKKLGGPIEKKEEKTSLNDSIETTS